MFIFKGLLNLPLLSVTLASNLMEMEKEFTEKNITWITINWGLCANKRLQKIIKHHIFDPSPSESLLNIRYLKFANIIRQNYDFYKEVLSG